jgi:hypothetical protein
MSDRIKDPRTWTMIIGLVNLIMIYLGATEQLNMIVNAAIVLVAFLLFGVEPVVNAIKVARAKSK